MKYFGLCLFSLMLLTSCASRKSLWEKSTPTESLSKADIFKLETQAKALWEKRENKSSLEEALVLFEKLNNAESKLDYLIYLTRGYYFLADAHLESKDEKLKTFEKATSFGELAMATNKNFKTEVIKGNDVTTSLATLTKTEVPAIYWSAASLGKWAKASGIAASLKYKSQIKAMIERVNLLDPTYFHAAVQRYWGGYYAIAPGFAGGDMNKSEKNFEESIKRAPHYLGTRVLRAEVFWTKKGNKEKFKEELEAVLKAKVDVVPELRAENIMEQKKAQKLLSQINDLF